LDGSDNVITLRTCGKALGCEGALVCSPRIVRDLLVNRARGFIFSTAPSPLMAAAVRASLRLLETEAGRRERLTRLFELAAQRFIPLGANSSGTQILPLILGDDRRTMAIAGRLHQQGFDVRGIRPPTVPPKTSRLRISITLNVDEQAIIDLADALAELV
jgi:8-amino-7-oxononanoate synthase